MPDFLNSGERGSGGAWRHPLRTSRTRMDARRQAALMAAIGYTKQEGKRCSIYELQIGNGLGAEKFCEEQI